MLRVRALSKPLPKLQRSSEGLHRSHRLHPAACPQILHVDVHHPGAPEQIVDLIGASPMPAGEYRRQTGQLCLRDLGVEGDHVDLLVLERLHQAGEPSVRLDGGAHPDGPYEHAMAVRPYPDEPLPLEASPQLGRQVRANLLHHGVVGGKVPGGPDGGCEREREGLVGGSLFA